MSVPDEITRLEEDLADTRAKIAKVKHIKETEEGSSNSRFMARFTSLSDLRKDEHNLMARLNTLKGYVE